MKRGETLAVVAATLIALGVALGVSVSEETRDDDAEIIISAHNCRGAGPQADGSVRFQPPCPISTPSPDGRWTIIQTPPTGGEEEIYNVLVKDPDGRTLGSIPDANDGMPLTLRWSPRRDWFLINHYRGSGLEQPRVFQITLSGVVEHRRHLEVGLAQAHRISRCLPVDKIEASGSGLKWSRDGRRLAWAYVTRPDMCVFYGDMSGPIPADKQWKPFLMISDVDTGAVVADSIRLLPDDGKWDFPTDGPYADF